jgi:hypothetical protein
MYFMALNLLCILQHSLVELLECFNIVWDLLLQLFCVNISLTSGNRHCSHHFCQTLFIIFCYQCQVNLKVGLMQCSFPIFRKHMEIFSYLAYLAYYTFEALFLSLMEQFLPSLNISMGSITHL